MTGKPLIVLSHFQAKELLLGRAAEKSLIAVSPDLGLSTVEVKLEPDGVIFPDGQRLDWKGVDRIRSSEVGCFLLEDSELRKIQTFSEHTKRHISLMPTERAPTMLLAGFPMHRIKGIDPYQDTRTKIRSITPVIGLVLDTATGLGYTAIEAAKTADKVITIEIDPAVLEVARLNPWSKALFEHPKIEARVGNSLDEVQKLESEMFERIIHDPPTFSLAGDLYSGAFYRSLFRVLKQGGRIFHYTGDLKSHSGRRVTEGVIRRLKDAGFRGVSRRSEAFGVVAYKGSNA
jgi:predicted methyltransferase